MLSGLKMQNDVTKEFVNPAQHKAEDDSLITLDLGSFPPRYKDIYLIGCGARSLIFSAIDQTSLRRLAVKKVSIKENETKRLQCFVREIRILHRLEHQNIVKIYHVLLSKSDDTRTTEKELGNALSNGTESVCNTNLYIGMELMDTDLQAILSKCTLQKEYVRLFMYQILRGVKYLHSANVMHRDLTPSNIFINVDTLMLKLGDFGASRLFDSDYNHERHLTMPLTTKYYQAPELLLHPRHYTKEMDIWSIGCVFIEMLSGTKAFPGEHVLEQLGFILEKIPVTRENWLSVVNAGCSDIECCASALEFEEQENGGCPANPLETYLSSSPPYAINLLKQLLSFDPSLRIDAEDGLAHPYLSSFSYPNDEPSCTRPFYIEDEIDECSVADLQAMLLTENNSINASFSRSGEANSSQSDQIHALQDANLMHTKSVITTNGSYRHLLSLAETIHTEVLSESEARTIACDLDYGVQIHECSLNKDRMSMDFRPISNNAGCFDPYKWDMNTSPAAEFTKKESLLTTGIMKLHKSLEPSQTAVSRLDTGYHSSYCSSSITNRMSNVASLSHWSLSSLDISSDHEQRHGSVTPDSINSPSAHTNTELGSADSPTFHDDTQVDGPAPISRRHNDSLHQSGPRRIHHSHHHHHHHSHHHHHHHHHHGKHKSRQSHSNSQSTCNQQKGGSGDSSGEQADGSTHHRDRNKHKHDAGKKSKSVKVHDSNEHMPDVKDNLVILPKNIVVTGPDNSLKKQSEGEMHNSDNGTQCTSDVLEKAPEPEKSLSENENSERRVSAFSKYSANTNNTLPTQFSNSELEMKSGSCVSFLSSSNMDASSNSNQDSANDGFRRLSQSTIENMWKANLDSINPELATEEKYRPRTWSEGCSPHSSNQNFPVSSSDTPTGIMMSCRLVQKIRTQISHFFPDNWCLNAAEVASDSPPLASASRMRHFSDDRSFICSPRAVKNFRGNTDAKASASTTDAKK